MFVLNLPGSLLECPQVWKNFIYSLPSYVHLDERDRRIEQKLERFHAVLSGPSGHLVVTFKDEADWTFFCLVYV